MSFICFIVSAEYFSNMDNYGRRLDIDQRPELRCGTVEFVATDVCPSFIRAVSLLANHFLQDYCSRPPEPLAYVFVIDVSSRSFASGMIFALIQAAKTFLRTLVDDDLACARRVGLVTYDSTIHFYSLKVSYFGGSEATDRPHGVTGFSNLDIRASFCSRI